MINSRSKGLLIMVIVNVVFFLAHYFLAGTNGFDKLTAVINLQESYFVNTLLSVLLCSVILLLHKTLESQVGFVFLGLTLLKMFVLYFVLNPTNKLGEVATHDAVALFIPFGLNLVMEQVFIVKLLNLSDLSKVIQKE